MIIILVSPFILGYSKPTSSRTSSNTDLNPLAPIFFSLAFSAIVLSATSVNSKSISDSNLYNSLNCFVIACLGSVNISTNVSIDNSLNGTNTGNLPNTSGIIPYSIKSSGLTCIINSLYCCSCSLASTAPNPTLDLPEALLTLFAIILSRPTNAPPAINNTLSVLKSIVAPVILSFLTL